MVMIAIYKLTSPSGKVYIGQTINTIKRFSRYRTLNCKGQPKLYTSLKRYGFDNHVLEIIRQFDNVEVELLNDLEEKCIAFHINAGFQMLNISAGGNNRTNSAETIARMSLAKKGKSLIDRIGKEAAEKQIERMKLKKGVPHSKEHVANISAALMGKKLSPEHVAKLKGQKRTPEMLETFRRVQLGKKRSPEQRKALSIALKKRFSEIKRVVSPEGRAKMKAASIAYWGKRKEAELLCQA